MGFDPGFDPEIVKYIDKRLDKTEDYTTISKEIHKRWPVKISDETVASMYITYCKEKRKARPKAK